jgi:hypothetical protein
MKKLTILLLTILMSGSLYSQEREFYELYTDGVTSLYEIDTNCVEIDTVPVAQNDSIPTDTVEYTFNPPEYYVIDGDTIGIILSIEQVQKIDSDLEMLKLFKLLDNQVQGVDEFYISVINDQNEKISILETTLGNIKDQSGEQEELIENLKKQVKLKSDQYDLSEEQYQNDLIIIEGLKKDLRKQKIKTWAGAGGAGALGIGGIILTIFLLK